MYLSFLNHAGKRRFAVCVEMEDRCLGKLWQSGRRHFPCNRGLLHTVTSQIDINANNRNRAKHNKLLETTSRKKYHCLHVDVFFYKFPPADNTKAHCIELQMGGSSQLDNYHRGGRHNLLHRLVLLERSPLSREKRANNIFNSTDQQLPAQPSLRAVLPVVYMLRQATVIYPRPT